MPFERQSDQWKNARAASLQTSKKRREASSSISHLVQPQLDDDKVDTNDNLSVIRKVNRGPWYESVNERDWNSEEEGYLMWKNPIWKKNSLEGSTRLETQPQEIGCEG